MVFGTAVSSYFLYCANKRPTPAPVSPPKGKGPLNAVFITGCDSGFGKATSRLLADSNSVHVFAGCLTLKGVAALSKQPNITPLLLDVTNEKSVGSAVSEIKSSSFRLLAIVNNAGIIVGGPADWNKPSTYSLAMSVNFGGVVNTTLAFLPLLRESCRTSGPIPRIINISSVNGIVPLPFVSAYAASKHATEAFSRSLRLELQSGLGSGVCKVRPFVTVINPGTFKTEMASGMTDSGMVGAFGNASLETQQRYGGLTFVEKVTEAMTNNLKFAGDPSEVADCIANAVLCRSPRRRYFVGRDAWLYWVVWGFVPEWAFEWAVEGVLGGMLRRMRNS